MPAAASARVERFAVLVGANRGGAHEAPLRFAEDDAAKVRDVLEQMGGFAPEDLVLLRDTNAGALTRALIAVNDRIRGVVQSGQSAVLFVYYSGHAAADGLHLGSTTLEIHTLEQLVRGSAASLRILVLDACRSGTLTRVKGGQPAPPFDIDLDSPASQGTIFLTASTAGEDAQESDEIRGSFFTHYFVSGLLGAADQDGSGEVTLDEAYRYAYENTVRASSRTAAGLQHPTFEYDLHGQGKVPLTLIAAARARRATLSFPGGRSFLVLRNGADGAVVAEVSTGASGRLLSVRPGTYFIRGRGSRALYEGTVSAREGELVLVDERRLARIEYGRLVRKGEDGADLAHNLEVGYQLRTAIRDGETVCQGPFVGYLLELHWIDLGARVGFCTSSLTAVDLETTDTDVELDLRALHAWDLGGLTLQLGAGPGAALLHQSFVTRGVAPDRTGVAGNLAAEVTLGSDLWRHLFWSGRAQALAYVMEQSTASGRSALGASAAFAAGLSLGWHL
jgi:hypothetical protein